ncbi:hypothetical protein [Ectobacillus panaciterrae]|uniref:hypothetical protein n=1 Tax=Ectobacillus panaciterrae TaxID=363872 RepID=UPI0004243E39|nr:hypothetical protein [Ectobacillus panaciterrae]
MNEEIELGIDLSEEIILRIIEGYAYEKGLYDQGEDILARINAGLQRGSNAL